MLNTRLKKVLWIPRAILLINFIFFLYCQSHYLSEYAYIAIATIQFILLIAFFFLSFRAIIISGILFILSSFFVYIIFSDLNIQGIVLSSGIALAGILLIILPIFFRSKRKETILSSQDLHKHIEDWLFQLKNKRKQ